MRSRNVLSCIWSRDAARTLWYVGTGQGIAHAYRASLSLYRTSRRPTAPYGIPVPDIAAR
eukprot:994569-Rhodomonas_salina.2